jgi:hypothetical protein
MSEIKNKKNGSIIATGGFRVEDLVVNKFNDWKQDEDSQKWLLVMGYDLAKIEKVVALKITGSFKSDVQIQVNIFLKDLAEVQNISVKLASNEKGFNQIDKRWTDNYAELWKWDNSLTEIIKKFTGEISPRSFLNEIPEKEQEKVISWFQKNKILILCDILKGRGKYTAEWMLVYRKLSSGEILDSWVLKAINEVINFYGQGEVLITKKGNLKIGKVVIQRKGGDSGKETANMLQFKFDPCLLFDEEK